jgi:hypothetical protein
MTSPSLSLAFAYRRRAHSSAWLARASHCGPDAGIGMSGVDDLIL